MNYQNLNNYTGELYGQPQYKNAEYDWEVADNLLVGSPGGVSTIHHHYTKGFNGRGNTSSDVYAGQGQRYLSGEYGSLYQTGQTASQAQGYYPAAPDYQFWQNQTPQQYDYDQSVSNMWDPSMKSYSQPGAYQSEPQKKVEGYQNPSEEGDYEMMDGPDSSRIASEIADSITDLKPKLTINPWMMFILFLISFIVFAFWSETGLLFVKQKFHGSGELKWQRMVIYSSVITAVFIFVIFMSGVPIATFEVV